MENAEIEGFWQVSYLFCVFVRKSRHLIMIVATLFLQRNEKTFSTKTLS